MLSFYVMKQTWGGHANGAFTPRYDFYFLTVRATAMHVCAGELRIQRLPSFVRGDNIRTWCEDSSRVHMHLHGSVQRLSLDPPAAWCRSPHPSRTGVP
jgi:hypothetical protein